MPLPAGPSTPPAIVEMRLALDRVREVRRTITVTPERGLPVVVTAKRSRAARLTRP